MADIELVIKIDEEMYKWVNDVNKFFDDYGISDFIDLVKNGTPLPKGHGKLGDLDALREEVSSWGMNDYEPSDFTYAIDQADTIIEADKKYEVEYEVEYEAEVITRGNCMMCGKELTDGLFFCKECEEKGESEVRE